ncbi:MAG: putative Fe-S cluster assembly protein SufT [Thermoanaerobaculia bacterium]|jgi:probable FeS assembly SUF system protein SufT
MYEEVSIKREVGAIQIPDGSPVVIPEGTKVLITQSLGGSFTVMTDRGAMYRIDERNADALGKEPAENASQSAAPADAESLEQLIWSEMKKCFDPEIPVNVVDLGLIYDCQVQDRPEGGFRVEIKMTLTAPGCGMGPVLAEDVRARLEAISGVEETEVEIVFDPPWNPNMMTDAARLQLGFM